MDLRQWLSDRTLIVCVGSGGVGKTTVSVNLACSLASLGKSVGIFDVDIDCPNVANILHLSEGPTQNEKDKKFLHHCTY